MKKIIRLTESDLHRIVKESVKKILKESTWASQEEYEDELKSIKDYYLAKGLSEKEAEDKVTDYIFALMNGDL